MIYRSKNSLAALLVYIDGSNQRLYRFLNCLYNTGGGFALSDASTKSGLSAWIGTQLTGLSALPPFLIMFIVIIIGYIN